MLDSVLLCFVRVTPTSERLNGEFWLGVRRALTPNAQNRDDDARPWHPVAVDRDRSRRRREEARGRRSSTRACFPVFLSNRIACLFIGRAYPIVPPGRNDDDGL